MIAKLRNQNVIVSILIVLVTICLSIANTSLAAPMQQSNNMVEPKAGTWKTWVLKSSDQFKSVAPPDDAATKKEMAQLMDMAGKRDDAAMQQIAYWNSGPASYRWNEIGVLVFEEHALPL